MLGNAHKKNSQFLKDIEIILEWFKSDWVITNVIDQSMSCATIVLIEVKKLTNL